MKLSEFLFDAKIDLHAKFHEVLKTGSLISKDLFLQFLVCELAIFCMIAHDVHTVRIVRIVRNCQDFEKYCIISGKTSGFGDFSQKCQAVSGFSTSYTILGAQ